LVELDPLRENARLVTARAQLESGDREAALTSMQRADSAPVYVEGLQMQRSTAATTVFGRIVGNAAAPGEQVALRFVFYDEAGASSGTQVLEVAAPPPGEAEDFEVRFDRVAAAYSYDAVLR
jgi:hypothetical protein